VSGDIVKENKSRWWRYFFVILWTLNVWGISSLLMVVLIGNQINKLNAPGAGLEIGLTFIFMLLYILIPLGIIDVISISFYYVAKRFPREETKQGRSTNEHITQPGLVQ
jgi:hypothetical protein